MRVFRYVCKACTIVALLAVVLGVLQYRPPVPPLDIGENGLIFGDDFFFGLATAPAHVEDKLEDSWVEFARRDKVAAWSNTPRPEERVRFWTEPEVEINLAVQAGAKVLRLGIDWERVMPSPGVVDEKAVAHYGEILLQVKQKKMKVMLTLFHHSAPTWVAEYGGWTNPRATEAFVMFAMEVIAKLGHHVDYWTIFNEPHVYTILTHCAGVWPPGKEFNTLNAIRCFSPIGDYAMALWNMANAHRRIYKHLHHPSRFEKYPDTPIPVVGVAHHVGYVQGRTLMDIPSALYNHLMSTFWFPDLIHKECDFIGLNYYGQEFISGAGVAIVPSEEYSDAGRGIYPDGMYRLIMSYHKRYGGKELMITENGVSDDLDVVRSAYMIEHLVAIKAAMNAGAKVTGYVFWTISDNWEWADGYCPKFGLVSVDRHSENLTRTLRPSYHLFNAIATAGRITQKQRDTAWNKVTTGAATGLERPFCRDLNAGGMTGAFGIDEPMPRKVVHKEWRYGMYEQPMLDDPVGAAMETAIQWVVEKAQPLVDMLRNYISHQKDYAALQWTRQPKAVEAEL